MLKPETDHNNVHTNGSRYQHLKQIHVSQVKVKVIDCRIIEQPRNTILNPNATLLN